MVIIIIAVIIVTFFFCAYSNVISMLRRSENDAIMTRFREYAFGLKSLYSKHPTMEGWPRNHSFSVYAMRVEDVFMLDNYGGSHKITVTDYLNNTYYDKLNRGFQKKHLDEVAQV